MYMSNNGRVKVVIESCILLIALVIVSCLYTAELSKSRNVLKEENKNGVVHEEKKQSKTVKNALFDKDDYKAEGFKNITVVVDAGHGGKDEGARSNNRRYREKDCNLAMVKKLKQMLDQTDINVIYTRLEDRYITKKRRTVIANMKKADLFISIHCNASDNIHSRASGIETLYAKRKGDNRLMTNRRFAHILLDTVEASSLNKARKCIRREDLFVLRHTDMPAVIVETGYMSNRKDMSYINSQKGQYEIADGIYKGIIKTLKEMNKADEEFMNKVINVIQENISDENFNVERMADILCMSRSSLLRKIKILFNLSPIDFIRLIRLKKAAELIQEGKYRIGDICYMVGINSSSYFSKLFLKQFGMTPKEFEKQYQTSKEKVKIDLTGISD